MVYVSTPQTTLPTVAPVVMPVPAVRTAVMARIARRVGVMTNFSVSILHFLMGTVSNSSPTATTAATAATSAQKGWAYAALASAALMGATLPPKDASHRHKEISEV